MADFCKACSIETFGKDYDDLVGLISAEEVSEGYRSPVICEGCGFIYVDDKGQRWDNPSGKDKDWILDPRLS